MNPVQPDPDTLHNIRTRKLLSQQELAKRSGLSRQTIALLEAGQIPPTPRLQTIRKVCDVLGVDPSHVWEFRDAIEALMAEARRPRVRIPNAASAHPDVLSQPPR